MERIVNVLRLLWEGIVELGDTTSLAGASRC